MAMHARWRGGGGGRGEGGRGDPRETIRVVAFAHLPVA